uniref:Uncharacterized protein n=1 Tax=Lotus japonicus TaxID=34305 RepID=I3T3H9_LOTJA|nr:unknown [Lotus japonicus]
MGCVSSKLIRKDIKQEHVIIDNCGGGGRYLSHVVSLTSSTYGALKLDKDNDQPVIAAKPREEPEAITTINAWELMEGLEDGVPISNQPKKSPKSSSPFLRGFMNSDTRSPLKFLNQLGSPKTVKKSTGKENKVQVNGVRTGGVRRLDYSNSPKGILKPSNLSPNASKNSGIPAKGSPICARRKSFGGNEKDTLQCSSRRKSQSPLFDPELVASYEKELSEEEEQVKRMVWATPKPEEQGNRWIHCP